MGNPFTSSMDAALFISGNPGKFDPHYEALYVYDGLTNQYMWSAASAPGYPESGDFGDYVQAGQGFFVLALYDNIAFNFTSTMQSHQTGLTMLKSGSTETPWPGLELRVAYGGGKESRTLVVYNSEMTTGNDPGYDVGQMSTGPDVEIYTALVSKDNSINFARQALPVSGADTIAVPVGIDSEKGGEVTFSAYTIPLGTNKFWLEDRTKGVFTDLSTSTYKVVLPVKTYGTGRFYLKAANSITGIETPAGEPGSDLRIWAYDGRVIIKGEVCERTDCSVFDMHGSKIIETQLTDKDQNIVEMPSGAKGVYLVRVTDRTKTITRKIVLL
jgi:hypothetical protein